MTFGQLKFKTAALIWLCILFTCDLQRNSVLFIIDAHHDFAPVQTRVAGTQTSQGKTCIVTIPTVTWQSNTTLEGLLHLRNRRKQLMKCFILYFTGI